MERASLNAFFAEMEAAYRELYVDAHLTGGVPCPPSGVEDMLAYPRGHPHAFRWMAVPFGHAGGRRALPGDRAGRRCAAPPAA